MHVLLSDLQQRGHCRRYLGRPRIVQRAHWLLAAVRIGHRINEQIRIAFDVVVRPSEFVAGHLLGRKDRLLHRAVCADLAKLRKLHVLQALRILGQPDVALAALDVVDEPALAINRDYRDFGPGYQPVIFQHLAA